MPTDPLYVVSLAISVGALSIALLKLRVLRHVRLVSIFFSLGAGQIHIAVLALLTFLVAENNYRLPVSLPKIPLLLVAMCFFLIVLTTMLSPIEGRTLVELFQLLIYMIVLVLFMAYLEEPGNTRPVLSAMVVAGLLVAVIGGILFFIEAKSSPHIFLGRGGNEGAIFLLLTGIIPAISLFAETKRPIYLLSVFVMLGAQFLATSRTSIILGALIVFITFYLMIRERWFRIFLLLGLTSVGYLYWDTFQILLEGLKNYSASQRILLYEAGWAFWLESPLVGWGWGATSVLASQEVLTDLIFPHFHSTYIQFLVELGWLGVVFNAIWFLGAFWLLFVGMSDGADLNVRVYITAAAIALIGLGFTSALLFGADRAVQVVLVIALVRNLLRYQQLVKHLNVD